MATHDVILPASKRAVFPPFCVGCERPEPGETTSITIIGARTRPALETAADAVLGSSSSTAGDNTHNRIENIPICSQCGPKLKWYHRKLKFATYTGWLPGGILLLVPGIPLWLSIAVLLAGVLAPPLISMIYPPAFGGTFLNDSGTYEFRSKKIADEFAALNISQPPA